MAFAATGFDPTASGSKGAGKIAFYATTDNISTVEGASYFNTVSTVLKTGDILIVKASDATRIYTLTSSSGTVTLGGMPNRSATVAALAGTLTGTVDGTLEDVAAIALSTSNTYTDAAVNTAVNTAITSVNLQLKEIQTVLNAVIAALKASGLMASS